jgi:hypothetical protein
MHLADVSHEVEEVAEDVVGETIMCEEDLIV